MDSGKNKSGKMKKLKTSGRFGNIGKMSKLLEKLRKKMKQIDEIKKQIHYKKVKLPKQKKTGIELEEIILPPFESIRQKK